MKHCEGKPMKALEKYVKKHDKASPFKGDKGGPWKGGKGVESKKQYAKKSGRKIVDDKRDYDEDDPATAGEKAYSSEPSKKKLRSYLDV